MSHFPSTMADRELHQGLSENPHLAQDTKERITPETGSKYAVYKYLMDNTGIQGRVFMPMASLYRCFTDN